MNLRFIDKFYKKSVINKKIQGKFLYYLFTVIISLFFAAFILYYLFKGSDVQNYKAEDSSLRNDKEVQLQSSEKINNKKLYVAGESIELNENIIEEKENLDDLDGKNLDKFSDNENSKKVSIPNFKQFTSQKPGKTDIENIKPANNNIFANIEKFEKPIIDDTIKLLPETELSNYEIYREDSAISKELLDGITVALFENQTDNLDSNEITYNYINTSNEAVLRRLKGQSHISLADFNDKSSITFSDYLFQAENKLIKVRLIAFEEYDVSDKIFMPEAFGVNIISWNDNMIEMDWFINSGILEIPPEEIKIQVSGKNYIKIALGIEAVYGIGSSN